MKLKMLKIKKLKNELIYLQKEEAKLKEKEKKLYQFMNEQFKYAGWVKHTHPAYLERQKWEEENYDPISDKLIEIENKIFKLKKSIKIEKALKTPKIKLDDLSIEILKYLKKYGSSRSLDIYVNIGIKNATANKARYRLRKLKEKELVKETRTFKYDVYRKNFKSWDITEKGIAELKK